MYLRLPAGSVSKAEGQGGDGARAFDDVDELVDAGIFTEQHVGVMYAIPGRSGRE